MKHAKKDREIAFMRARIAYLEALNESLSCADKKEVARVMPKPPLGIWYDFDYEKKDNARPV